MGWRVQRSHVELFLPTADFGVSGELTASVAKRRSFIGTPYW